MKRPLPKKSILFCLAVACASAAFVRWTNDTYRTAEPTTAERAEAWRVDQLEHQRAENYVENIKPHVAR